MDVELTLEERKRILKEAGLYEEGMTREQIRFCCQALSETEDAASDENIPKSLNNNRQDVLNQKEEEFFPKSWSSKVKVIPISSKHELINELTQNDDDLPNESTQMETSKSELSSDFPDNKGSIEDATKSCFGFNEMLESTENTLKLIPTKPKLISIQWFEKFLNANNHTKAKMLYSYHTKMNNLRVQAARKSFFAAPMPPIITCDSNFNNSETKDTYVSRSGRQTKRKVYYENEDSSDGVTNVKKTKNSEEEWCGRKGDTNKIDKMREEHDSNKMEDEVITEEEPEKKVVIKNPKQPSERPRQKKLTNTEIMKRSSLFVESPPRYSRNDILFDKLKEKELKRKKQDISLEIFERTIEPLDEEINDKIDEEDSKSEIFVDDEQTFPRRVVPPVRGRKLINGGRNKTATVVIKNSKQPSEKPRQKKLTNSEIMTRSSLFVESPPRYSRNDVLFDKLKEEEIKRNKQEKSLEKFERSIEPLDEENNDKIDEEDSKNEIISVDDKQIFPRRVVPPVRGRKLINGGRNKTATGLIPLSVEITSISNNSTAGSTTSNIKAAQTELQRKRLSEVSIEILPTTSNDQNTSTSTVECPMCGQYFPDIEIEAHAWTCSDEQPSTRSSLRSSRITKMKMICEICDSVVPFNTNYEVHVRECIKRIERESQPNR